MAARSYFGKGAKALSVSEGALLAGLAKGPNYYNPDTKPERAQERMAYVLSRMQDDGFLKPDQVQQAIASLPPRVPFERTRRTTGFHFVDHVRRLHGANHHQSRFARGNRGCPAGGAGSL
jgi:membrane peptidoglycan carboxypeptidase